MEKRQLFQQIVLEQVDIIGKKKKKNFGLSLTSNSNINPKGSEI